VTTEALLRVDPSEFGARRDAIVALDAAARAIDGHDALGDTVWRDLAHPAPDSAGFLVAGRVYVHVARSDGADPTSWTAGIVRLPDAHDDTAVTATLAAAVAHVREHRGHLLTCWLFGATDADDAPFAAAGFAPARALYEMRTQLPRPEVVRWPPGITVRSFVPGSDDAEWLTVNNRAFGDHHDQGGWHESTLRARIAEPWFDPRLFLLAFDDDGLAGFNWLKHHAPRPPDPALGEIYVIGVDPRAQGTGLGRALAVAGLELVYSRGDGVGMLFCAADNTGALGLYRSLGFEVHRTDRAYVRPIETS
jgi:mycothiol synthase